MSTISKCCCWDIRLQGRRAWAAGNAVGGKDLLLPAVHYAPARFAYHETPQANTRTRQGAQGRQQPCCMATVPNLLGACAGTMWWHCNT